MAQQTATDGTVFENKTPETPGVYLAARSLDGPRFFVLVARIQGKLWGQLIDGEAQAQMFPAKNRGTPTVNRFRNLLWARAD